MEDAVGYAKAWIDSARSMLERQSSNAMDVGAVLETIDETVCGLGELRAAVENGDSAEHEEGQVLGTEETAPAAEDGESPASRRTLAPWEKAILSRGASSKRSAAGT